VFALYGIKLMFFRRNQAMDLGLKKAVDVPMSIIRTANQCWPHLISLAEHGNISCKSDLQVCSPTSHCKLVTVTTVHRLDAKPY